MVPERASKDNEIWLSLLMLLPLLGYQENVALVNGLAQLLYEIKEYQCHFLIGWELGQEINVVYED